MIGVVIRRPNRNKTPPDMFIHSIGERLRTSIDLCRGCRQWKPGGVLNCQINESFRRVEVETQTRVLRTMCPAFDDRREPLGMSDGSRTPVPGSGSN